MRIFLTISFFLLASFLSFGQEQQVYTKSDSSYNFSVYVGGSLALYYKSEQPVMAPYNRPWQIYIDIGKNTSILAFRFGGTFTEAYKQDFVIISSNFAFAALELTTKNILPKRYEFFGYAGPNIWTSSLRFVGTTYKETDWGPGFDLALGANYFFGQKTRIGLISVYNSSARGAYFYAGSIEKQNVGVGGIQIMLNICYNIL